MDKETTEITPAMLRCYQQQQAAAEQQRRYQLITELVQTAAAAGYEIIAMPQFTNDGRTIAAWGVQQKAGT